MNLCRTLYDIVKFILWMNVPKRPLEIKSVFLRVTTCPGQATRHYRNQWWPSSQSMSGAYAYKTYFMFNIRGLQIFFMIFKKITYHAMIMSISSLTQTSYVRASMSSLFTKRNESQVRDLYDTHYLCVGPSMLHFITWLSITIHLLTEQNCVKNWQYSCVLQNNPMPILLRKPIQVI